MDRFITREMDRLFTVKRLLKALMISVFLALPLAQGEGLSEGAELMITNVRGDGILGYGVVRNGVLELTLSENAREFVLILVSTDGDIKSWSGRVDESGRLELEDESGARFGIEELAAEAAVQVSVNRVASEASAGPAAPRLNPAPPAAPTTEQARGDGAGEAQASESAPDPQEPPRETENQAPADGAAEAQHPDDQARQEVADGSSAGDAPAGDAPAEDRIGEDRAGDDARTEGAALAPEVTSPAEQMETSEPAGQGEPGQGEDQGEAGVGDDTSAEQDDPADGASAGEPPAPAAPAPPAPAEPASGEGEDEAGGQEEGAANEDHAAGEEAPEEVGDGTGAEAGDDDE
ncbi:hypothetical protein BH24DEI1_BH24DEI1_01350 [soil metagenome]